MQKRYNLLVKGWQALHLYIYTPLRERKSYCHHRKYSFQMWEHSLTGAEVLHTIEQPCRDDYLVIFNQ
jgi:hypothetical protein